jgi:hypothetical protein
MALGVGVCVCVISKRPKYGGRSPNWAVEPNKKKIMPYTLVGK